MIDEQQISAIASSTAQAILAPGTVARIISEPTVDSQGNDALHITIVINPQASKKITGNQALDTLAQLQTKLQEAGEQRFAVVDYATEDELIDGGD